MAQKIPDDTMDASLDFIAACDIMHVCKAEPANYAGIAAESLADIAMTPGDGNDYDIADDASGRKITTAEKLAVDIDVSDDATHVVLALVGSTSLRLVTTCDLQTLTSGGTVDIPAWKFNMQDP